MGTKCRALSATRPEWLDKSEPSDCAPFHISTDRSREGGGTIHYYAKIAGQQIHAIDSSNLQLN